MIGIYSSHDILSLCERLENARCYSTEAKSYGRGTADKYFDLSPHDVTLASRILRSAFKEASDKQTG